MTTNEALEVIKSRERPREDDWELLEAAEIIAERLESLATELTRLTGVVSEEDADSIMSHVLWMSE